MEFQGLSPHSKYSLTGQANYEADSFCGLLFGFGTWIIAHVSLITLPFNTEFSLETTFNVFNALDIHFCLNSDSKLNTSALWAK